MTMAKTGAKTGMRTGLAAAGVLLLLSTAACDAANDDAKPRTRAEIEEIVREYILENPEILPEAIAVLQQRESAAAIGDMREELETPYPGAFAGNPDGSVVLVEFFDFNCGFCKRSHADVEKLIAENPDLKVVYRDFPILNPLSKEAAMAALSAANQGKYQSLHDALMEMEGRLTKERLVSTIREAGLDEKLTARDMKNEALEAELQRNLELGRRVGATGTPTYVIGDRVLSGAVGYAELQKAVDAVRSADGG